MRVMKKRRKTFQSTLTNTHSARCSSARDTSQTITFVSGRRRGVDLRQRALLLLFLLVFLTAATKGTGEREEDDAALRSKLSQLWAWNVSKALDTNLREMVALLVGLGDVESVPFC